MIFCVSVSDTKGTFMRYYLIVFKDEFATRSWKNDKVKFQKFLDLTFSKQISLVIFFPQ